MKEVVLPGDVVQMTDQDVIIGCGFDQRKIQKNDLLVMQPGIKKTNDGKLWISMHSRRYVPQFGDNVLGIVTASHSDSLKVDVGSADLAMIDSLAFEGATKTNRPNIKTGDVIFANVLHASKHMEPEVMENVKSETFEAKEMDDAQDTSVKEPADMQSLSSMLQGILQHTQDRFKTMSDEIIERIDSMSKRIDDLEKNITDLMMQTGTEEP